MASVDPSLISNPEEHKWVIEIDEILDHQLEIEVEPPPVSLFQVPETITSNKPEAYEPQQIGLGPIHHFRPRPYKKMEQKKLAIMRKVVKGYNIKDYKLHVLNKVRKVVPVIRSCYDMFLQDDDDSLARILAIDGLFLLMLFQTYKVPTDEALTFLEILEARPEIPTVEPEKRLVAQDILMVGNQIPIMVLKEIDETLHATSAAAGNNPNPNPPPSIFRVFCEVHSPLKLCKRHQAPSTVDHLLHYMYYSIVNNIQESAIDDADKMENADADDDGLSKQPHFTDRMSGEQLFKFITKIPEKEIIKAYEQTVSMLETFSKSKTLIPSASILHHKSGFQFQSLEEDEGIQNIRVEGGKDIYLPRIDLNIDSEVILRNLVAYETLTANSDSFLLNEYMGMMCGLIINKDDVKYLKSQNVITGDLGEDEVVKLFTKMSGSMHTVKTKGKSSKLQQVIDEINKVYECGLRMKTYLLLKKLAGWLLVVLKAIGSFVESSWKIVAFMVSIVTLFLLIAQAYCDSFGCDNKTGTLLPYASI